MDPLKQKAAEAIRRSRYTIAFTGAGISVESGIPPFRGTDGIWNKYDPKVLEIDYYLSNTEQCWVYIRKIFYDFFAESKPNNAHLVLARMEKNGLLKSVITQNIDHLHQEAGSVAVHEFHGNSKRLVCLECGRKYSVEEFNLNKTPPLCKEDGSVLKPDFVFFGEGIPDEAYAGAFDEATKAEVCLVIGSTGEVYPAAHIPYIAKKNGAAIIEINPEPSSFTRELADIWLKGKAGEILLQLEALLME
jgi:NAD-dependent deacetylase